MRIKTTTTRLPAALVEKLNEQPVENDTRRGPPRTKGLSRKETRKLDRGQKKQRKAEFFGAGKRPVDDGEGEHEEAPKAKRVKLDESAVKKEKEKEREKKEKEKEKAKQREKEKEKRTTLSSTPRETEEDRYISYLESKLGYGKSKSKGEDDGLDDLLDFADTIGIPAADVDMDGGVETSEDEEEEDELELEDFYTEDEEEAGESEEDEWKGIGAEDEDEDEDEDEAPILLPAEPTKATAYVPPHLRNAITSGNDSEEFAKLQRNLKGLLNRMSEQNLGNILDSIEELYRNHSRNDVTSSLTSLIISGISAHALLLDSYVVLHAALIASLHKILGVEFAANFVQNVVSGYETHYASLEDNGDENKGKECSNLLVLLAELYNFQVVSCVLIYDLIRTLLDGSMSELDVELLLKLIRSSGQQLRLDDPLALKDITQIVQEKVALSEGKQSSRTLFMIETLTNLKNNKIKKVGAQNQGGDATERMKKFLSSLSKKRQVVANEPLRVLLADLHSAETRGKWWLVGAAWGGDPLVDRQQDKDDTPKQPPVSSSNALLKLAKKQGMNTDIRRSVFVVLMSSDDYVDACDRLSQLNLTEIQQREIIRVLLHCCGNEKTYNPYYTLVCQQLCRTSHAYKITLQFCLWDFLRDLGQTEVGGAEVIKNMQESGTVESFDLKNISTTRLRNVAQAYAWWIAKDCVTLSILKPVDFTVLKPQTVQFLSQLLVHVMISSQVSMPRLREHGGEDLLLNKNRKAVEEIFIKATRLQTLSMGLVYFFSSNFKAADGTAEKFVKWATEVAKDTLRTGVDIIPDL